MYATSQLLIETIRQRPVKGFVGFGFDFAVFDSMSSKLSVEFLHQFSPSPLDGFRACCMCPGFFIEVGQLLLQLLFVQTVRPDFVLDEGFDFVPQQPIPQVAVYVTFTELQLTRSDPGGTTMETTKPDKTISQVFEEFLVDQEGRISSKTFSKYESIIQLYALYLENYWPGHNGDYNKINAAGGTYCSTFGLEDATEGYSKFLGYFMPRKVMCGKETMQAAGTVTKKLAKWLAEKGYIEDSEAAQKRAGKAANGLPSAQTVLHILNAYCNETVLHRHGGEIQDHFCIDRIEPGKLWLNPLTGSSVIGPISVPKQVTALCKPGWDIGGIVAKVGKSWRLVEVWNVSPQQHRIFSDDDRHRCVEGLGSVLKPSGDYLLCAEEPGEQESGQSDRAVTVQGPTRSEGHQFRSNCTEGMVNGGAAIGGRG